MEVADIDVRIGGGPYGRVVVGDTGDLHRVGGEDRVGECVGQGDRAQHYLDRAAIGSCNDRIGQANHERRVVGGSRRQVGEAARSGNTVHVGEGGTEVFRVGRYGAGIGGSQRSRGEGIAHMDRGQSDVGGDRSCCNRVAGSRVGDHVSAQRDCGSRVDHREGGRSRSRARIRLGKREADVVGSSGHQRGNVGRGDHGRGGVAREGERGGVRGVDRVGDTHARGK